MGEMVTYALHDAVATITMDDGKVNALSLSMFDQLDSAFDRAQQEAAVVVLAGRPGIFSAGFDLKVLRGGGPDAVPMLQRGFRLAERMLSCPLPVLVVCPGHAIAMGAFLLLSGDHRIGVTGEFRITANEVAIGLTMPRAAVEICRQRLAPAQFNRAVIVAEAFSPDEAVAAGFLDQVVSPSELGDAVATVARRLATLDPSAHRLTKLRAREPILRDLKAAMELDDAELMAAPEPAHPT